MSELESRACGPGRPVLIDRQREVKWVGALHSAEQIVASKGQQYELGRV